MTAEFAGQALALSGSAPPEMDDLFRAPGDAAAAGATIHLSAALSAADCRIGSSVAEPKLRS